MPGISWLHPAQRMLCDCRSADNLLQVLKPGLEATFAWHHCGTFKDFMLPVHVQCACLSWCRAWMLPPLKTIQTRPGTPSPAAACCDCRPG